MLQSLKMIFIQLNSGKNNDFARSVSEPNNKRKSIHLSVRLQELAARNRLAGL